MDRAERERRHQANLERIKRVQLVVGRGDGMRVDAVGTLIERANLTMEEIGAHQATEAGLAAFERLLRRAEERSGPHTGEIVAFLTAIWNNGPLPVGTLRGLDAQAGEDMLAVLDAFRRARLDLTEQVEGGPRRLARVLGTGHPQRV